MPPFELSIKIASCLLWEKRRHWVWSYLTAQFHFKYWNNMNMAAQSWQICISEKFEAFWKMKQKQLQSLGKGNKPSTAEELSENYFKLFYERQILGPFTSTSLTNSMFMICTNHFGMRPGKEIQNVNSGYVKMVRCRKFTVHCI